MRTNVLSRRIIGCALPVLHVLGTGFVERVYQSALMHELRKSGLAVSPQHRMLVRYDGIVVGDYTVDLLVEHGVLVELKAAKAIDEIHRAQCLSVPPRAPPPGKIRHRHLSSGHPPEA